MSLITLMKRKLSIPNTTGTIDYDSVTPIGLDKLAYARGSLNSGHHNFEEEYLIGGNRIVTSWLDEEDNGTKVIEFKEDENIQAGYYYSIEENFAYPDYDEVPDEVRIKRAEIAEYEDEDTGFRLGVLFVPEENLDIESENRRTFFSDGERSQEGFRDILNLVSEKNITHNYYYFEEFQDVLAIENAILDYDKTILKQSKELWYKIPESEDDILITTKEVYHDYCYEEDELSKLRHGERVIDNKYESRARKEFIK